MIIASEVAEILTNRFGLDIFPEPNRNSSALSFRPSMFPRPHGIYALITVGLATATAHLKFDRFSRPLMEALGESDEDRWSQVSKWARALTENGIRTEILVNGKQASDVKFTKEENLESLIIKSRTVFWKDNRAELVADLASAVLGPVFQLLEPPIELGDAGQIVHDSQYQKEGQKYQAYVTRYERSQSNRALAITLHGLTCKVCGFNFEEVYGLAGAGYVEIHHENSLHLLEEERVIDVAAEMIPLCSNCHRMAHRVDPPYSPEKLREMLGNSSETGQA